MKIIIVLLIVNFIKIIQLIVKYNHKTQLNYINCQCGSNGNNISTWDNNIYVLGQISQAGTSNVNVFSQGILLYPAQSGSVLVSNMQLDLCYRSISQNAFCPGFGGPNCPALTGEIATVLSVEQLNRLPTQADIIPVNIINYIQGPSGGGMSLPWNGIAFPFDTSYDYTGNKQVNPVQWSEIYDSSQIYSTVQAFTDCNLGACCANRFTYNSLADSRWSQTTPLLVRNGYAVVVSIKLGTGFNNFGSFTCPGYVAPSYGLGAVFSGYFSWNQPVL